MKTRTIASILLGLIALTPALSVAFPEVGGIATDCTVEALEGGAISLSDYSDQIIVLFCLAVSDSRCIKAAPAYEANVHQVYKDWGVTVLGVDVDQGDTSADLSAFRDEHGINFPLAMDSSGNCWSSYRGDEDGHLPVFYLIGRDRVIKAIELGYRTGREKEITSVIDELLFEERPTINLGLNRQPDGMTPYLPGDTMEVYASLENPGYNEYQVTAFIAAGLGDDLFFWPSYSTIPQGTSLTLPPGFSISDYQIDSIPLAEWVPKGIHNWYAVLVDDATGEWLRDVEMVSWPFGVHERPSGERIDLIPPDDLWDYVCSNIGHEGEPFGYTEETMEMCNYYGHEFRLHQVWDLWRNVNDITAFTGEVSDFLLANSDDPAACATYCFDLLAFEGQEESRAGKKPIGGKDSLPVVYEFKTIADETNWDTLPAEIQDFVGLIVEASTNAAPSVESAFDKPFLASSLGISEASLDNVDRADLYNLVSEPWWNYSNANAPGFDAMYHTDLPALGSATSAFLTGVASAIDSLREYLETNTIAPTSFDTIEFSVGDSEVLICGTGNQQVFDNYSLIIDLGGDDSYIGSHAIPRSFSDPIGAIIDISGNDRYSGGSGAFNLCCGLFGIGAIFDLSGSDEYSGGQSSIAAAWHGAGILVDYEGGDTYDTNSQFAYWSQGAARCGLGLLMDLEGNDSYDCLQYSQAFGGTLGIGAIVDVSGDDDYHAEGVYSDPFYTNV
ncbi:MAG: peroxiredoxin family protein, partial [Candidatus Coatesbacteria bacterium]|nr:peroxiredoxin family protein [Candidatus Coatesbacteria bacterium]